VKIRPTPLSPNQASDSSSLRQAYKQTRQQGPNTDSSGSVQLSTAARAMQQLQNEGNDIHTERVQAIKTALQSGTLQIDPAAIADGLIDSAKELLK